MDNLQLLGLQAQRVMQRRMEMTANNIANISTNGFKAESVLTQMDNRRPARSVDQPHDVRFVRDMGMARNLGQGALQRSGEDFDVAIEGDGFFVVEGPGGGPAYTRDGAFRLDSAGQLVTRDGRRVLTAGGAPIALDPQGSRVEIGADGGIRIAGQEAGQIGVVNFAQPLALEKISDNLWSAGGQPPTAFEGRVVQGAIESSNVNGVLELTRVIEIQRAYESVARIVRSGDELRQRTLERLSR